MKMQHATHVNLPAEPGIYLLKPTETEFFLAAQDFFSNPKSTHSKYKRIVIVVVASAPATLQSDKATDQ
jgi:hypothetical protein